MKRMLIILIALLVIAGLLIKKPQMTWKQSILKAAYPIIMFVGKLTGQSKNILLNKDQANPSDSFYDLIAIKNNGDTLYFSELKGKKVLLVNTASDCGYTGQYEELEQLHKQYGDRLVLLGFPANDFKDQEKKSDADIAAFCKVNYGVSFQLMKKGQVIKGANQQNVYQWLTDPSKNGWCSKQPDWNFSKYLINENGVLDSYYSQWVSPKDIPIN
ncbi:MAG TPA: glutathione peroxidase [Sediminibacterium sp.]|uniref:glutathione peroxidase n=1 Tax=Sediminibacterium sp. TaxID=1917865 RepID=UPI000AF8C011|nr:glutathione peroxidase [Sediminibacterium sp.]HLD54041.1 glutathione peroxidase [Sediminibacterium sp.]